MKPVKTVAVTGASGYVGEAVCRALTKRGIAVRALSRRDPGIAGTRFVAYDLRHELEPGLLSDVDAVIHAAAETFRGAEPDIEAEIAALYRLAGAAAAASARLIFVSSQTARTDAPTGYGRLKAHAEQIVLDRLGAVVRPGQVYGGAEKGLWGTLSSIARRAPAIPRFMPEPLVQPIHVDDLADALVVLACGARPRPRVYAIADSRYVAFSRFIQLVAVCRFGRRPLSLPVPLAPILWVLRGVETLGVRPAFARRLASLNDLPRLDSAADMAELVPDYRRFPAGACRGASCDRSLVREGAVLLRYATGRLPGRWLLRSYARAVSSVGEAGPLELSGLTRLLPGCLTLFDQPAARRRNGEQDALSRRIDLALLLGESSAPHVDGFLMSPHTPTRLAQLTQLGLALLLEAVGRLADAAAGRWLDRVRPRPIGGSEHGA